MSDMRDNEHIERNGDTVVIDVFNEPNSLDMPGVIFLNSNSPS